MEIEIRYRYRYRYRLDIDIDDIDIDISLLVHAIKEAERSHDLLSASWRFRKASSIIQSEWVGLRM